MTRRPLGLLFALSVFLWTAVLPVCEAPSASSTPGPAAHATAPAPGDHATASGPADHDSAPGPDGNDSAVPPGDHASAPGAVVLPSIPGQELQSQAPGPDWDPPNTFSGVSRIVAIGDIHGDIEAFKKVLRLAGLLDDKDHWSGGSSHLVQTGDVVDRGDSSQAALELLMQLEKEAATAGGQVHALLGNHEVMNILDDLRYVSPADLASYESFAQGSSAGDVAVEPGSGAGDVAVAPGSSAGDVAAGIAGHRFAFGVEGPYGRWLRARPSVIKINDVLFVHGGISPDVPAQDLSALNRWVRQDLFPGTAAGGARARTGPLWFRGYAMQPEPTLEAGLDEILKRFGARLMVMGHTVTGGKIYLRFKGRAVFIDTGISAYYGRNLAAIEIRGTTLTALYPDKREVLTPQLEQTAPLM